VIAITPTAGAPIAQARADIRVARAALRQRTYDERVYRHLSRLIDLACERVERVNLEGGTVCPAPVRDLVAQLDLLAGRMPSAPATPREAHERLLELSSVLLGRPLGGLEFDAEAER
jgi:hypothetical protein